MRSLSFSISFGNLSRLASLAVVCLSASACLAGEPFRYNQRRVAETRFAPRTAIQGTEFLGTFEPTPYVIVRGNGPTGGGYTPFQNHGDSTMVMYGPMSVFRSTTAPVTAYVRGYNGALQPVPGISFSNPNLPGLSPVVYPTRSTTYFRSRFGNDPVMLPKDSMNWIDQN